MDAEEQDRNDPFCNINRKQVDVLLDISEDQDVHGFTSQTGWHEAVSKTPSSLHKTLHSPVLTAK